MENPTRHIPHIIRSLTQYSRKEQWITLEDYFLPDAYFVHPFCRVPSFGSFKIPFTNKVVNSRKFIFFIYQWYRILSPEIKLEIDSTSFDKKNCLLYVSLRQTFTIWFVPFSLWQANVRLVTVLNLRHLPVDTRGQPLSDDTPANLVPSSQARKLYFIKGQEDHYQVEDFLKFIAPWGASVLWMMWQLFATLVCTLGVLFLRVPVVFLRERVLGRDSGAIKKP